jgi:hypothetical protein
MYKLSARLAVGKCLAFRTRYRFADCLELATQNNPNGVFVYHHEHDFDLGFVSLANRSTLQRQANVFNPLFPVSFTAVLLSSIRNFTTKYIDSTDDNGEFLRKQLSSAPKLYSSLPYPRLRLCPNSYSGVPKESEGLSP